MTKFYSAALFTKLWADIKTVITKGRILLSFCLCSFYIKEHIANVNTF